MSLTYAYNNTGTVRSVTGSVNGTTVNEQYRYDPLQRLTNSSVTSSSSAITSWYEYDNLGNRVRQKLNSTITRYSYNSLSELTNSTTYSNPQVTTAYSYDPNGNLKTQNVTSTGTIRWAYAWDASGRLLTVTNSTGQVQYAYDGSGRMVEAIEGGSIWRFAYTGTDILYKDLRNMDNYEYVYASGLRIVMVIDRASTYYYHADVLGSVRMITYSDATYVYINNYQPFGKDNGTPKGTFQTSATDKFAGERWTAATGLFYNFQRWYDPSIGRFISKDLFSGYASNPETLNAYVYVADAPTTLTDRTGMFQGSGVENRCEKLHEQCSLGPPSQLDMLVLKLNIALDIVGGGIVLCIVACPVIAGALAGGGGEALATGGVVEALTGSSGATLGLGIFGTLGLDALDVGLGVTGAGAILGLGVIGWEALYGRSPSTGPVTSGDGGFTGGIGTTVRGGFGTGIEIPRIGSQLGGVRPGEGPRLPGDYGRERPRKDKSDKGADPPWALLCTGAFIAGAFAGYLGTANMSDQRNEYAAEGGIGTVALALCVTAWWYS